MGNEWSSRHAWIIKTRERSTYMEHQESGTGFSIRHPWKRVAAALLLLGLNTLAHFLNPVAASRAFVSIPLYATAYNFIFRAPLPDDTTTTLTIRVVLGLFSALLGCFLTRVIVFPFLRRYLSMFSAGHAQLRRQAKVDKSEGGLVASNYRTVNASANGGRPYSIDVHCGSISQGSWTLMLLLTPLFVALIATVYNAFVPPSLAVTSILPIRYVDCYPALRAISIAVNVVLFISICDIMLQDRARCEAVYDNWMPRFRVLWRYQWLRIVLFWLLLSATIVFAILGLPQMHKAMFDAYLKHIPVNIFYMESWRSLVSGAVVMLDFVVLMQDWDFPTMGSPKHVLIPGFSTNSFSIHLGKRQLVFTCKWIIMSLILLLLPLDMWSLIQQLSYIPNKYGQVTDAKTHQILSVTNTTYLDLHNCGALCYNIAVNEAKSSYVGTEPTAGRYFGWPMEDKFPAICLVLFALFLFVRMIAFEDGKFVVSSKMQGVKEQNYRRQLESTTLPQQALLDLERLAEIKRLYSLRKHADDICVALSLFGLIMMLLQLRCIWQVGVIFANESYPSNMFSSPGQTYALLIFFSTILLLFVLVHRFKLTVDILKLRNKLPESTSIWRHPRIRFQLLLEIIVNLLIVPPFVIGSFVINEFQMKSRTCSAPMVLRDDNKCFLILRYPYETFGMIMFLRLYWIVRLVRNHSGFYGQRVDFIGSLNNVSTDSPLWHFRAIFYHKPIFAFLTCTIITWVATAVGVSVMERPLPSPLDSEITAMWMIIVTMATVGYGDYVPRTHAGRVITVIGGILGGVIVISMLTSLFMGSLQTTRGEEKVLHVVRYKRWQRHRLNASVNLIAAAWRLKKLREKKSPLDDAYRRHFKYMQQVRELRLGAVTEGEDTVGMVRQWHHESIDPIFKRISDQRNHTVDELEKKIHHIRDLVQTVHSLCGSR
ncbi:hypothetical protein AeMF1_013086 [Aphanomyces euteiches]|nr:hypothetical protein AeMF1_013086 [Aphanomyces euteiches]KAH9186031.1 hypothetical protein AeNC1_011996 [Aphanomyces euteiches]